ncbi:MAG: shikimate kinase [Betaproteobacteria bacterium]|nr:shikimate kinase [Betaproteobacteria bacterium]
MHVVFLHGPPAAGKHTIGQKLSELTGLPLFHNHLAVDTAKSLFAFGTPGFNRMRATLWRAAFAEAAVAGQSFIFTFNPEATVDPGLIEDLCQIVRERGGTVYFIELKCSPAAIAQRIGNESRKAFGKLTDPELYKALDAKGAFAFPPLPEALLVVNTDELSADSAAERIAQAIAGAGSVRAGT